MATHGDGAIAVVAARLVHRVTLVDVGSDRWSMDARNRPVVSPLVGGSATDCAKSSDPTFPRLFGKLCGPRAVVVRNGFAYVAAETSNAVTAVQLPASPTGNPVVRGSAYLAGTLDAPQALALDGARSTVYVAARGAGVGRVVDVDVSAAQSPVVRGTLDALGNGANGAPLPPAWGTERLAVPTDASNPVRYVADPWTSRLVAVDARCIDATTSSGVAVERCLDDATVALYDPKGADDPYYFRATAAPPV